MIGVVVADDNRLLRRAVRRVLEQVDDIKVIGEASDGQVALELVERLGPGVLVLDVSMPRLNGIQACERVGALDTPTQVVMFSTHADHDLVRQSLRNGAKGYVLKDPRTMDELIHAVRAADRGETYLSSGIPWMGQDGSWTGCEIPQPTARSLVGMSDGPRWVTPWAD